MAKHSADITKGIKLQDKYEGKVDPDRQILLTPQFRN